MFNAQLLQLEKFVEKLRIDHRLLNITLTHLSAMKTSSHKKAPRRELFVIIHPCVCPINRLIM